MYFDIIQQVLSIAAPLAIVVGGIIALLQLRSQNRLRQFDTVLRLFLSFGEESFLRHYRRVTTWEYDTYEDFKQNATEDDNVSLMVVSVFYENMGLLYKRGLAPLELLDDLNSAPIISSWRKVKPIWVGLRAEHGQPQWVEFYEMLADAMAERLARLERKSRTG
jgi:hypothetical protein